MYNLAELREMQRQDGAWRQDGACAPPPPAALPDADADASASASGGAIGDGGAGGGGGGGGHAAAAMAEAAGAGGCLGGGATRLSAALEVTTAEVLLVIWSVGLLCDDFRQDPHPNS